METQHSPKAEDRFSLLITDTGESPILDTYMEGYEKVFTLPDESEDRDGFASCLSLNHGDIHKQLARDYGEFREIVGVAHEESQGVVGGANFFAGPVELEDGSTVVTVHLNYAHIDEEHRRSGRLHKLVEAVSSMAAVAFTDEEVPVVTFLEQNDPLAMSRDDYIKDTEASGIDQVDRLNAWTRLSAKIVDFPYVQPELSPDEEPNRTLALAAITKDMEKIPNELLRGHLHRFFGVTVAKGEGLAQSAKEQMEILDSPDAPRTFDLIDPAPAVSRLRSMDRDKLPEGNIRSYARDVQEQPAISIAASQNMHQQMMHAAAMGR